MLTSIGVSCCTLRSHSACLSDKGSGYEENSTLQILHKSVNLVSRESAVPELDACTSAPWATMDHHSQSPLLTRKGSSRRPWADVPLGKILRRSEISIPRNLMSFQEKEVVYPRCCPYPPFFPFLRSTEKAIEITCFGYATVLSCAIETVPFLPVLCLSLPNFYFRGRKSIALNADSFR